MRKVLFFAMTKPKKKLNGFLKCVALVVLLAVIVPAGYMYLSGNGALESFRQVFAGTEETLIVNDEYADSLLPGEAIRVGGVILNIPVEIPEKTENNADNKEQNEESENTAAAGDTDQENQEAENPDNADNIANESPGLISRLIELIFGRENKVEVYE